MYRGNKLHRKVHPKIFVWSHTEKAEIEYFQDFKNHLCTPLLMPKREICWTPQALLVKLIDWKNNNINELDNDQVWCIFDVDDFYKKNKIELMRAINNARKNNIRIAFANECFELWILLHFMKPTSPISRGNNIQQKIQTKFKKHALGTFVKNQKVFNTLIPFMSTAVSNSKQIVPEYGCIDWEEKLSERGNPSTSIHFLVEEIITLLGK